MTTKRAMKKYTLLLGLFVELEGATARLIFSALVMSYHQRLVEVPDFGVISGKPNLSQ
ncbi:MAG: hypothetical protein HOI07_00200 [Betaproteobacteria bacterium]|nr:hypothetical protein [Betaproteobacteria bacterium]